MSATPTTAPPATAPGTGTSEADAPKKGRRRLLLIAAPLLALALGAGGWFLLGGADDGTVEAAGEAAEEPIPEGAALPVAELTGNLADEDASHFARISVAVVLAEDAAAEIVEPRLPLLEDAAVDELAALTAADLHGADGPDLLRGRLTERAMQIWPDGEVLRVLLTELLVQ